MSEPKYSGEFVRLVLDTPTVHGAKLMIGDELIPFYKVEIVADVERGEPIIHITAPIQSVDVQALAENTVINVVETFDRKVAINERIDGVTEFVKTLDNINTAVTLRQTPKEYVHAAMGRVIAKLEWERDK